MIKRAIFYQQKVESIQYNAALVITGAFPKEKRFEDLGGDTECYILLL